MYKFKKLAATLAILTSLTTGCANRATGSVSPLTDLSALKNMYVKHYPSDNSGVNVEIADKLRSKGVTVTTGSEALSKNYDAIVTYIDKWMWDITMYMLELTITIRDPKNESLLATGNSYHTSLTRMSQTEMVDEVINNIYSGSKNAISQNTSTQQTISPASGSKASETSMVPTLSQKLKELEDLRKDGTITEDEYTIKRKQLIEKF